MLTLPAERRAALMELLLALPPQQRGGNNPNTSGASPAAGGVSPSISREASEALTMLEADGVFRLSAAEARELLASIHEDS